MRRNSLRTGLVAMIAALSACGGGGSKPEENPMPTPTGTPKPTTSPTTDVGTLNLLEGLERRVLANGMIVLVKEDHRLPVVSTVVAYRVGSVNETDGKTGLAHFLEHMMFKGTDTYRKGEIDWRTFLAGGANNAYTSEDMTAYWFAIASDRLDDFLALEANRMRNCTLDPKEYESERQVVLEELNRMMDGPWGKLHYEIDQKVFKTHSYRHPTIGFIEDLRKMTYEDMAGFYRAYYGPNNATLVVVGDCKKEQVFAKAKELFGPIAKVATPPVPVSVEPPQRGENRSEVKSDHEVARLGLAFRSAKVGSDEDYVLDLISMILAPGPDTRLSRRLVDRERLVSDGGVDASNNTRKFDGVFYVYAELQPKKSAAAAEKAILEELAKLAKDPVSAKELQKVKNLRTAQFVYEKEDQLSVADGIARFEAYDAPDYLKTYLSKINAVTPEKIREVAAQVFRPENRTVVHAKGAGRSAGMPHRDRRAFRIAPTQAGPIPEFGEYHEVRLANGLTILVKPKHDLPVLSIQAFVNASSVYEDAGQAGVAMLTGRMLDQGSQEPGKAPRTASQIAEEVAFVGGMLSTSATGAGIKVLSQHRDFGLDLLRDVLMYPAFPKEEFEKCRDGQVAEIVHTKDSPSDVARLMFREAVYGTHPAGRPDFGSEETVQKLTRDDLAAQHRRFFRPDNTIVAIVGDVTAEAAVEMVRKRFGSWEGKGDFSVPALPPVTPPGPKMLTQYRKDSQQLNYVFGHLSVDRGNPDWYALRVLEYVFCRGPGFTDRLSKTVRDELGLCYTISGDMTSGADEYPGPFFIYVGTGVERESKAYDTSIQLMRQLIDQGPTAEEVEASKSYLLRSFASRWNTSDSIASYMIMVRRLNLGIDYARRFRRAVSAMTKEEIQRVAKKYLNPDGLVTAVVGPVDKDGKVEKRDEKKEDK